MLDGIRMEYLDLISYVSKKRRIDKNDITEELYKTHCMTTVVTPKNEISQELPIEFVC